jgi:hypothetical protein|tara:strand:- start:12210 stop:13043 length:834 start_codon:yes stop_codon:yes gene_type:complete
MSVKVAFFGPRFQFIFNEDPALTTYDLPDGFTLGVDTPILKEGVVHVATEAEIDQMKTDIENAIAFQKSVNDEIANLRIQKYFTSQQEPILDPIALMGQDFTTRGLRAPSPEYSKGRKAECVLLDAEGNPVVKRTFTDKPQENGDLWIEIFFEWFDNNDEVKLSKTETVELNQIGTGEHYEKRRRRSIAYLSLGASKFDLKAQLDIIYAATDAMLTKFEKFGDPEWMDFIRAEWADGAGSGAVFDALAAPIPAAAGYPEGTTIYHVMELMVHSPPAS